MALVGSISGSLQTNSLIGVSGTVIVANRPDALFPTALPGSDVSFFVSGSRGGKGAAERTVSLFGGDAVISGSLTIGTGSVTITSNDVQFGSFANRIELNGSNITFFDGNNTSGRTLTSLAAAAAGGNNTEVQYNNGGSLAGSSAFTFDAASGRVTATHLAAGTSLTASLIYTPASSADLYNTGPTTINFGGGASTLLSIGPSGGVTTIAGDLKVGGNDIIASDNQTNITMTSNSLTTFAGDIKVGGNDIQASNGTVALTLDTSGNVTVAGDLTVTGNDIKSSGGNTAITLTAAGNVVIPGDLTVNGTTVTADVATFTVEDPLVGFGFTSGSVAATAGDRGWIGGISGGDNVAMYWRNGSTEFQAVRTDSTPNATTINRTSYANFAAGVIRSESGFTGSLTKLTTGGDYLRGGSGIQLVTGSDGAVTITSTASTNPGGSNTSVQFNDSNSFGGTSFFTFDKNGGASGLGKLSVNETLSTTLTSSTIIGGASSVNLFTNSTTTSITAGSAGGSTSFQGNVTGSNFLVSGDLAVNGGDITTTASTFNLVNANATTVSIAGGATSGTTIGNATGGVTLNGTATVTGDLAVNGATSADITTTTTTATLFNSNATTLNIGGSATTMLVGASNVAVGIGGAAPTNSTITASTGSFGRVLASSTSTFTGATTHNGGITTTTLGVSSAASLQSTLSVVGNITGQGTSNQLNALSVTGSLGLSVISGATVGGALTVQGSTTLSGSVTLGDASGDSITYNGQVASNILPSADRLYNLGSPTFRWANVYTGDLHLRNERGNWTVIEEESYLSIRNNHTGKMYKFVLEEIVDPAEE